MDGYVDLTAEELIALGAAVGVRLPTRLLGQELDEVQLEQVGAVGRRSLLARGLVQAVDGGHEMPVALSDAIERMGDPFVITVVATISRAERSVSWLFIGRSELTVLTGLADQNLRLRALTIADLPGALARLSGLDHDLVPAGVQEFSLDLARFGAAVSEARSAGGGAEDTAALLQASGVGLDHLDDALVAFGGDGVVHAVVTTYPDPDGTPKSSSTAWVERDGTALRLDLRDDGWLHGDGVAASDLLDEVRQGFPTAA